MIPANLPLPDKAGRGMMEKRVQLIVRDMVKVAGKDPHEFDRLSHELDKTRKKFHDLYGVKEHPVNAPIHEER